MISKSSIEEAKAWTRKYFKAASEANWVILCIKGINESKLISRPTQQPIQLVDEITTNVPTNKVTQNNNREGFLIIRMRE